MIRAVDAEIVDGLHRRLRRRRRELRASDQTLFPGGSGGSRLTAPDDLLETGVEIEARPAGRNVRRLSLLSGGERSLVAMAFLFAVFRSRPSPFYLMDEVEAALDEANLQRFLELLDEFRDEAQLIVVSHQKRTMEVADALYGVSMQPGGASKVVSERLRAVQRRHVRSAPMPVAVNATLGPVIDRLLVVARAVFSSWPRRHMLVTGRSTATAPSALARRPSSVRRPSTGAVVSPSSADP